MTDPGADSTRLISWNLLHQSGAELTELAALIDAERPDILLMQEAKAPVHGLAHLAGGHVHWAPLPGRGHGLAIWTRAPLRRPPHVLTLPAGAMVRRIAQIAEIGGFTLANVHLSHGQLLNRRQMRAIERHLPLHAAIAGDTNMVGPTWLPGFHDVGPRLATHHMSRFVPLRLDRCLVRGLVCTEARVLQRGGSDHHPILLGLRLGS